MPRLIVICGATATGKSDLALSVAGKLDAEIVNADSMQLYKGMDIGTAKLSVAERNEIPHHLLDIVEVTREVTVAWYQDLARTTINEILSRGRDVVVVGGTGLYIKAILDDLNFPETDPKIRQEISDEAEHLGAQTMHNRLAKLDPAAALAIPKENVRRVVRALEVIAITGRPFTANLPRVDSTKYPAAQQFGLVLERNSLNERIDLRVEKMWKLGLVDEVAKLIDLGLLKGRTAQAALGYAQIIRMKRGECTVAEAKEETSRATRQYARRQETWFSKDERITWLAPGSNSERLTALLNAIVKS